MTKRRKSESGQSMVLIGIALVALLGFTAIAIDVGSAEMRKAQLQSAIDSAVLAAAQSLPDTAAATTAANSYIQKNGFSPSDISISFTDSNTRVSITATKSMPTTFAKVLGISSTTVKTLAIAEKKTLPGGGNVADNFVIFSGSKTTPLSFGNGWGAVINGSVHTNKNLNVDIKMSITGQAEAVAGITTNNQWTFDHECSIPNQVPAAPYIPMPVYPITSSIPPQPTGVTWVTSLPSNATISSPIYFNGDFSYSPGASITISGNGCIIATGNVYLGGGPITIKTNNPVAIQSLNGSVTLGNTTTLTGAGAIYAERDVSFSGGSVSLNTSNAVAVRSRSGNVYFGNTLTLTGTGNVIAKQNITMVGNTINVKCTAQPMLHSESGNINFEQAVNVTGTVYAPYGQIRMVGGFYNLTGSLIADNFYFGNAVNFTGPTGGSAGVGGGAGSYTIKLVK